MRKTSLSIKILTALAVVVVALGVAYAIMLARATARLRQAYADLEKDGRPMQAADVIPPEVPDMQNGAVLYESAALLLKAQPSPEVDRPARERDRPGVKDDLLGYVDDLARPLVGGTLDPNRHAELKQLMGREAVIRALSAIEQAAQRPACRFNHGYERATYMNPYLSDLRALTGIVGAKACLEAEAGRPEASWSLAQAQVKMADGMRTEPLLISQMVRLSLLGLSCRTIRTLARTSLPNNQQYENLMSLLDTVDEVHPLARAVDGERILIGEWMFTLPKEQLYKELRQIGGPSDYWPESVQRLQFLRMTFKPFFLADHAAYLQLTRKQAQLCEQPYSVENRNALEKEWFEGTPKRCLLTHTLSPAVGRIKEIHCRMAAEVRITRTGLALLRYRAAHGGFPATLDTLGLRDVSDPFTGKPLLYRVEDKGFVLYSVGEDLKDNGGNPKRGKQHTDYDLVWRFPAPQDE